MSIRPLTIHDLKCLEKDAHFPLPDVNNPLYFYQIAVEDEKGLVGIALVKLTTEICLVLDSKASKVRKTKALLEIWEPIERKHEEYNLEDTHAFLLAPTEAERESFSRTLQRLGFKKAAGIPLFYMRGARWQRDRESKRINRRQQPPQTQQQPLSRTSTEVQTPRSAQVD